MLKKKQTHRRQSIGESSKFPKSWTLENQDLKLAACLQITKTSKYNGQTASDKLKLNQKGYYNLQNSAFWGWLSNQNPEKDLPWQSCKVTTQITKPDQPAYPASLKSTFYIHCWVQQIYKLLYGRWAGLHSRQISALQKLITDFLLARRICSRKVCSFHR